MLWMLKLNPTQVTDYAPTPSPHTHTYLCNPPPTHTLTSATLPPPHPPTHTYLCNPPPTPHPHTHLPLQLGQALSLPLCSSLSVPPFSGVLLSQSSVHLSSLTGQLCSIRLKFCLFTIEITSLTG